MTTQQNVRDFYGSASEMTSIRKHAALLDVLPRDVDALVRIIQGLVVYDVVASDFYGFIPPDTRTHEIHIRRMETMLDRLLAIDAQPLSVARPAEKRLVGRCHHFVLLLVAMLRAKSISARARSGFGSYFKSGYFEDHWVCEYWNATEARWVLVDPQFDDIWRARLEIDHDILDVPHDRFLVAGDAWLRCRVGQADPARFGIEFTGMRGLWFIAGSLVRDVAALNKVEMLPWDVWGAQPRPDEQLPESDVEFFDDLAELTRQPDRAFDMLRRLYGGDDRVRVPSTVFNALTQRAEVV